MSPPRRSVRIKIRAREEERAEWHRKARGTEKGEKGTATFSRVCAINSCLLAPMFKLQSAFRSNLRPPGNRRQPTPHDGRCRNFAVKRLFSKM